MRRQAHARRAGPAALALSGSGAFRPARFEQIRCSNGVLARGAASCFYADVLTVAEGVRADEGANAGGRAMVTEADRIASTAELPGDVGGGAATSAPNQQHHQHSQHGGSA